MVWVMGWEDVPEAEALDDTAAEEYDVVAA